MKKTLASIAVAVMAALGSMSAAEAIVIDKPLPAQASFTATAEAPPTKEEFEHFHVDNAGGVTGMPKVAGQQSAARGASASALDNPAVTARPAGEAPEPAVVLLVALGLVVIIRIRRQRTASE